MGALAKNIYLKLAPNVHLKLSSFKINSLQYYGDRN